jgi:hypothetical protein
MIFLGAKLRHPFRFGFKTTFAVTGRLSPSPGEIDGQLDRFITLGLDLPTGNRWREAASAALASDWLSHDYISFEADLDGLRAKTRAAHRQLTPMWRRRIGGSRLLSLDAPLTAEGFTLYDLLIDGLTPQNVPHGEPELDDHRIAAVLRALNSEERAVAIAWANDAVSTWAEAAASVSAVAPAAVGERVRRKLKRIGKQQTERAEAAAVTMAREA